MPLAPLSEVYLPGASLKFARGATDELSGARSLKGATMPHGQTYVEWLESKGGLERTGSKGPGY